MRRTQVGVAFEDADVDDIRRQIRGCLSELSTVFEEEVREFHFVEIYNRKGAWARSTEDLNLKIFEFFAKIYQSYRWPVVVQTVDKRTRRDLKGLDKKLNFEGLDPTSDSDLALSLLCLRIRSRFKTANEPLTVLIDEGRRRAGTHFGSEFFCDWPRGANGSYASSQAEPLLQIADFFAFCINRNTHLALKGTRSEVDRWFMSLVADMRLNSDEISPALMTSNFSVQQFDKFHRLDRELKGIED